MAQSKRHCLLRLVWKKLQWSAQSPVCVAEWANPLSHTAKSTGKSSQKSRGCYCWKGGPTLKSDVQPAKYGCDGLLSTYFWLYSVMSDLVECVKYIYKDESTLPPPCSTNLCLFKKKNSWGLELKSRWAENRNNLNEELTVLSLMQARLLRVLLKTKLLKISHAASVPWDTIAVIKERHCRTNLWGRTTFIDPSASDVSEHTYSH